MTKEQPTLPPLRTFNVRTLYDEHVTVSAHRYDIFGDFIQFVDYVLVPDDGDKDGRLVQTLGRRTFYRPLEVEEVAAAGTGTGTVQ